MITELLVAINLNKPLIAEYNLESFLPKTRNEATIYPSGLNYQDESHVKYGPKSIDDPVLLIVDPLFDRRMNCIMPGYYQLSLDSGREYMYLIQTGKILASIPVFKIEIDRKKELEKQKNLPPKGFIKTIKYRIKQKKKARKHREDVRKKRIEDEEKIYSEATIELDNTKKYYLIKYEKDSVRAWGAIKYR